MWYVAAGSAAGLLYGGLVLLARRRHRRRPPAVASVVCFWAGLLVIVDLLAGPSAPLSSYDPGRDIADGGLALRAASLLCAYHVATIAAAAISGREHEGLDHWFLGEAGWFSVYGITLTLSWWYYAHGTRNLGVTILGFLVLFVADDYAIYRGFEAFGMDDYPFFHRWKLRIANVALLITLLVVSIQQTPRLVSATIVGYVLFIFVGLPLLLSLGLLYVTWLNKGMEEAAEIINDAFDDMMESADGDQPDR